MTLLGGFNMGVASPSDPSSMNKSLDDIIADRRKSGGGGGAGGAGGGNEISAKRASNADRNLATSRVRRKAALDARRGLRESKKVTHMEIEKAVQEQADKTAIKKANQLVKDQTTGRRRRRRNQLNQKEKAAAVKEEKQIRSQGKAAKARATNAKAAPAVVMARPPSKKAVKAAVTAMESNGFKMPEGYQMVISFAPAQGTVVAPKGNVNNKGNNNSQAAGNQSPGKKNSSPKKNNNNNNSKKQGGGKKK